MVTAVRVDVTVEYVFNGGSRAKRANGGSAGLVAPDALDLDVVSGRLDGHAFVPVGDLDIVDPMVGA